nr:site-specific integrase [Mesorhizobium ciceri]
MAALKWSEVNLGEGLLELEDSKTGQSIRPLGAAAVTLLESLPREVGSSFVFPAERGDSYFQGTKRIWAKAIKKAKLPGVTPHTLRHTIGSTAISTGEALALTGAILGHSNPRSTAIYAHVQNDPSRRAANRVAKKIAAALAGNVSLSRNQKARPSDLETLVASLTDRLKAEGIDGARVQSIIADAIGAKH